MINDLLLKDLETISNLNDVDNLKEKYRKNGISHIEGFRKQANIIKKDAPNPASIVELEKVIDEIEGHLNKGKP